MDENLSCAQNENLEYIKLSNTLTCYRMHDAGWQIVPAQSTRAWMHEGNTNAGKCLPLLAANQMGWQILCPDDVSILWNGGNNTQDVQIFHNDSAYRRSILSHFGYATFTFQIPYLFRTDPEIGLMVRGATNFWIHGAVALDGFVETNWSNFTFTMNYKCVNSHQMISIKRGDPICTIIPYPIRMLENTKTEFKRLHEAPQKTQEVHRKWSDYRKDFNKRNDRTVSDWQKDYFMGRICPFSGDEPENKGVPHRTKFTLQKFEEKQSGENK